MAYQLRVCLQVVQHLPSAQGKGCFDGLVCCSWHHQHSAHCHRSHGLHLRDLCEESHLTEAVTHCQVAPAAAHLVSESKFCKCVYEQREVARNMLSQSDGLHLGVCFCDSQPL